MTKYSTGWKKPKQKVETFYHGVNIPKPLNIPLLQRAEITRGGISGVIIKALKKFLGVR